MALIKRKTRKKLSKQLTKLVKKHGAEMALALVTGIVSGVAAENPQKRRAGAKSRVKPPVKTIVVRKRA